MKLLLFLNFLAFANCQQNFTMEDSALFYRMEPGESHTDTEKSVQNIISWLQKRYDFGQKKVRSDNESKNLVSTDYDSPTLEPRPFGYSDPEAASSPQAEEGTTTEKDSSIPPQVSSLDVQCQKDRMNVEIEFTDPFNGIIYSKDHYTIPECRYVVANSQSSRYKFTVQLNSCGTQFVNDIEKGGQAYLENSLVIQNEPGILEIWDSVRSVRCQWEGSIRQSVTSGLSVVTPSTELVTFSGDTATAKLEIQTGRGPFANAEPKPANIGDMMTLVVKVEGDPEHQIRVGRCMANGGGQELQLSDDAGCPLRPKLMSAFEYTRHPYTNNAIAFSYFRAFRFPDSNELNFDCNVELCKKPCVPCQENKGFQDLKRKKRNTNNSIPVSNEILTIGSRLWISSIPQSHGTISGSEVCVSELGFYFAAFSWILFLLLSLTSTLRLITTSRSRCPKELI